MSLSLCALINKFKNPSEPSFVPFEKKQSFYSRLDWVQHSSAGKIDYELPRLPSLAPAARQKEQNNRFTAATANDPDLWYRFGFDEWEKEAGFDTIEYYPGSVGMLQKLLTTKS